LEFGADSNEGLILSYDRDDTHYKSLRFNALNYTWDTSGSPRMTIDASGNVGIGTISPGNKLEVRETSVGAETLPLQLTNAGGANNGSAVGIVFDTYNGATPTGKIDNERYSVGDYGLNFGTFGNWDAMTLRSGQLGIGTTEPTQELNVVGDGNFTGNLYVGGNLDVDGQGAFDSHLVISDPADAYIALESNRSDVGILGSVIFEKSPSVLGKIDAYMYDSINQYVDLRFYTNDADGMVERLRLKKDANEIIGDTNISGDFDVSGSVGIGTASPSRPLHIYNATTDMPLRLQSGDTKTGLELEDDASIIGLFNTAGVFSIDTDNSGVGEMTVNINGVGIVSDLEVDTNTLFVDASENSVGIGTLTPTQTFNVIGASNITQYSIADFMYDRHIYRETFPNGDDGASVSGDKITGDVGEWTVGGTNVNIQTTNGPYGTSDAVRMTTDTYITSPALDLADYYQYENGDHTNNEVYSQTRVFMKALVKYYSLDSSGETIIIEINDSAGVWHTVYKSTSDNQVSDPRGYHKITADLTPYISETPTDNYLRFTIDGSGGADYFDIDRVIIYESDVPTRLGYIHLGRDDVTIESDLDVTNNFTGNQIYGEAWGHEIGDVTISSSGVYYNITNLTGGELNGFTHSSGVLTPQVAGLYHIVSNFAFSGATTNEYHLGLIVNGVQQDKCHTQRKLGTGGDVGSAGFTCFYRLSSGDAVTLGIENAGAANDATIHDVDLNLVRIGD
jgi:hypothetical protein